MRERLWARMTRDRLTSHDRPVRFADRGLSAIWSTATSPVFRIEMSRGTIAVPAPAEFVPRHAAGAVQLRQEDLLVVVPVGDHPVADGGVPLPDSRAVGADHDDHRPACGQRRWRSSSSPSTSSTVDPVDAADALDPSAAGTEPAADVVRRVGVLDGGPSRRRRVGLQVDAGTACVVRQQRAGGGLAAVELAAARRRR